MLLSGVSQAQSLYDQQLQAAKAQFNLAYTTQQPADFTRALAAFDSAARLASPPRFEPLFMGMLCAFAGHQFDTAIARGVAAYNVDSLGSVDLFFYLADANFRTGKYTDAERWYSRFVQHPNATADLKDRARESLRKAQWAATAQRAPVDFRPTNLGPHINGPGEDYNPWVTADDSTLLFNSHREGCVGGYDARVFNYYGSDFYISTQRPDDFEDGWPQARNTGTPLNSLAHEKEFWLSPNGQELYCGRHPLFTPNGQQDCEIYYTRRESGTSPWSSPTPVLGGPSSPHCDSWPSLSRDGRTLYFCSDRPGGMGGYDVWVSRREIGGPWGPAENLGPTINTPGDEYDVFIHPDDQTLYWSSNYPEGFGGQDIFLSRRAGTRWGTPVNLGWPLNSPADDMDFFVNAAGTQAYINSDRPGGHGLQDLYTFPLDARIRPRGVATVKGLVTDTAHKPLAGTVLIIDLVTRDTVDQAVANQRGEFVATLPIGQRYAAIAMVPGRLFASEHFDVRDTATVRQLRLRLAVPDAVPGARIALRNVFFDVDSATLKPESRMELDYVAQLLRERPSLRVEVAGHTDADHQHDYNQRLSERRAEAVRTYLVQAGVPTTQLTAKGYGETRPLLPNTRAVNKARNRRVELVVL
jgi:outer membrane protein OmpA-like peptidoglycan-associated protein